MSPTAMAVNCNSVSRCRSEGTGEVRIVLTNGDAVKVDSVEGVPNLGCELAQNDTEDHGQKNKRSEQAVEDAQLAPYIWKANEDHQ